MNRTYLYRVLRYAAVCCFLSSCNEDRTPPSIGEIVGKYVGRYADGVETFVLKEDHTFTQEFKKNEKIIYSSQGVWKEDPKANIFFMPFKALPVLWGGDRNTNTPLEFPGSAQCYWKRGPIHIEISEWPYHVVKVSGQGATVSEDAFKHQ